MREDEILEALELIGGKIRGFPGLLEQEKEDLISESIAGILEAVGSGRFRGECDIRTLAFLISKRRVADLFREKYKILRAQDYLCSELPAPESGDLQYERRERILKIQKCMEFLSDRQKGVIWGYYFEGRRINELAEIMGIRARTVSSYRRLALERIREMIFNHGGSGVYSEEEVQGGNKGNDQNNMGNN